MKNSETTKKCKSCNKNFILKHLVYPTNLEDEERNLKIDCPYCGTFYDEFKVGKNEDYIAHKIVKKQICPKCGAELVERQNTKTKKCFYGCSNYPKCEFTKSKRK